MIDPTKLLIGNVVTFGGLVSKTIAAVAPFGVTFSDGDAMSMSDSLWQIAALNNPLLSLLPPTLLGGNLTLTNGSYFLDASRSMTPAMLLQACQAAVTALQASGITTSTI